MGLISRLRAFAGRKKPGAFGSAGLVPGGFCYPNATLASNETIFSAITMLSNAIASAPITLRRDYKRVMPQEHRIAWLMEFGLNPSMSTFQFIRTMETLRDATGAGYAVKELDDYGNLRALWPMHTENVSPMVERESREIYYQIRDALEGGDVYLHNSAVVAVSHISADGIHPLNPISVLQSSLDYDREVKEFSVNQMKNGLRAKFVIEFPNSMSREQFEEYNAYVKAFKKNGVLYLDGGKQIVQLKNDVIDPRVFDVENITIARVARVFNIPLEKFLPDKTSYSSAEQSDLNYLRDTILPMARMYEQEFSRKLLSEQERANGMQIKFSLNGFARADMKTRAEFYMKGVRTGWFSINDVRGLEDIEPIEGGETHYISKDLVPLFQALQDVGSGKTNQDENIAPSSANSAESISRVSLNGAQISSILEVIQAVAEGRMEFESAVKLLTAAFPFDAQTALQILGHPENLTSEQEGDGSE